LKEFILSSYRGDKMARGQGRHARRFKHSSRAVANPGAFFFKIAPALCSRLQCEEKPQGGEG
jgi:hypothetical protein